MEIYLLYDEPMKRFKQWLGRITMLGSIAIALVVATLATSLAVIGVWVLAGKPPWSDLAKEMQLLDLLRVGLLVAGGIGGAVALVVAYRKQKLGERNEEREDIRLFTERFEKASEQLSSEASMIRYAGVYAMASLADDWREERQTCIDVLCAYIRRPYTSPSQVAKEGSPAAKEIGDAVRKLPENEYNAVHEEYEVRQAIFRVIRRQLKKNPIAGETWHGCEFDFTGATIDGVNLSGTQLDRTTINFDKVTFINNDVIFNHAEFRDCIITFSDSWFKSVNVKFHRAFFDNARVAFSSCYVDTSPFDFRYSQVKAGSRIDLYDLNVDGTAFQFKSVRFISGIVRLNVDKVSHRCVLDLWDASFEGGNLNLKYSLTKFELIHKFRTVPNGVDFGNDKDELVTYWKNGYRNSDLNF
jgi:hypothetical protein